MSHGIARLTPASTAEQFREAWQSGSDVVVHPVGWQPEPDVVARLLGTLAIPGVATASPVPVASAGVTTSYPTHPDSPPAPSVPLPCRELVAFSADALSSLASPTIPTTIDEAVIAVGQSLNLHGWRHVAAPGIAFDWNPADAAGIDPAGGWDAAAVASMAGDASPGLEAHVSWASSQLGHVRLVVDGACLTSDPFTGTQHLVVEISRWLASTRPTAIVYLAVRPAQIESVTRRLSGSGVQVVRRDRRVDADVVYRPYQMLYAGELPFVLETGRRALIAQLDMIGFSNASYHPSSPLFFFARNLQRHLMRSLDAVTFISAFGRDSAFAECPDLEPRRLHVVSCGADPTPLEGDLSHDRSELLAGGFVVCLASTFWHKNRTHAIETFHRMVISHGYAGALVIGGPEPFFGRSIAHERELLDSLPRHVRERVHRWGHLDDATKWWLLRRADVVLYPSVVEGFGMVPFEAAVAGTASLSRGSTAPGELLEGTGAVLDSWDPHRWAERAAALAHDPSLAAQVVAEVAEVASRHTWEASAIRTWSAIDSALAMPRRERHVDDGTSLTRIGERASSAPAARLRFNVARGVPAVGRRVRTFARRTSSGTT